MTTGPLSILNGRITAFEARRPGLVAVCLLLIITAAVLSGTFRRPMMLPEHCLLAFRTAHNLVVHATFSAGAEHHGARPESGRPMPPGYPFVLAALAKADPRIATGIDCRMYAETRANPGAHFQALRILQAASGIGILVLVYYLTLELGGTRAVACASVVVYVVGAKLGEFARSLEPESFRNLAMFLALYLLVVGFRRRRSVLFGAAGICAGVAAFFFPNPAILLVALFLALLIGAAVAHRQAPQDTGSLGYPVWLLAGAMLIAAPWAARSLYLFGDPLLADRSQAQLLAFRLAYNAMPVSEWPLAILSWVPSYGNMIVELVMGEGAADRFGILEPGAYFLNGREIFNEARAATPSGGSIVHTLWRQHVLADPVQHLLTTIPVFTRGMWGTHGFMGIVGLCLLPRLFRHLLAGPAKAAVATLAVFAVLLAALHALVAPNFYWANTPVLFFMALAIAHALPAIARRLDGIATRLVAPSAPPGRAAERA